MDRDTGIVRAVGTTPAHTHDAKPGAALLPAYKRLSRRAEAVIAQAYLAGVNTRRVRRALAGLFGGRVGKDAVSRAWRQTRSAWAAWQARDLAGDDIVRLVVDGAVVKVRLDRRAAAISLLIVLGVRRDGQKGSPHERAFCVRQIRTGSELTPRAGTARAATA